MSRARNDRNIIKVGNIKRDEREWDRLEDRLQTDPNLGGGGQTELLVPGTYVPKVGLPPGIPYLYVIGNLMEGYPIDTNLLTPLAGTNDSTFKLNRDAGNYFGLGVDAIIGVSTASTRDPVVYRLPNQPVAIDGSTVDQEYVTAAGTIAGRNNSGSTMMRVRVGGTWVTVITPADGRTSGFGAHGVGPSADGAYFILHRLGVQTQPSLIERVDALGQVTGSQLLSATMTTRSEGGQTCVIENGWMLVYCYPSGTGTSRRIFYRPAVFDDTEWQTLPLASGNISSRKLMSVGSTGVAWVANTSGTLYRYDLNTGSGQAFPGMFFDPEGLGRTVTLDTVAYVADNICAMGGRLIDGATSIPFLTLVAIDGFGNVTLNQELFPDIPGRIVSAVMLNDGTLVFHLHSSNVSLLYGVS
jgi:hypothetical protein